MAVIDKLMAASSGIWAQYNSHPFVKGIEDGTLDRERFRYYIIQDYRYIIEYAKVLALGAARSKSADTLRLFASYVHLIAENEMDIHRGYMGRLGVTREELDASPPSLVNLSYTSYMLRAAYEGGEAETLAAILPCAYSYEVIARNIVESSPGSAGHPFYGDWISGYASGEYADANVELIAALENLTADCSEEQMRRITDIFTASSRYELAFWDMSWNMDR